MRENLSQSNQPLRSTQPGYPSVGRRNEAVMFCSWGLKADMACVRWQVKLCEPLYNTCHI